MTSEFFKSTIDINNFLKFLDKNISNFSSEPIVEHKQFDDAVNDEEHYDIKSPSSLERSFMTIRIYNKSHKIYFFNRNNEDLMKTFNEFKVNKMSQADLFSIIDILNRTGEKHALYNKEKNKNHSKKIKKVLNNKKELTTDIFFRTAYDTVVINKKGAWSQHGPTYIKRQHILLDDYSLLEWYILNYPLTNDLKIIINAVRINDKLNIAIKFKENETFIIMKDIEEFKKVFEAKCLSICLPILKKYVDNDITEVTEESITLLRMIKI